MPNSNENATQVAPDNAFQVDIRLQQIIITGLEPGLPIQLSFTTAPAADSIRSETGHWFDEGPEAYLPPLDGDLGLYSGIILESESLVLLTHLRVDAGEAPVEFSYRLEIDDLVEAWSDGAEDYTLEPLFRNDGPQITVVLSASASYIGGIELLERGESIDHKYRHEDYRQRKYGTPMDAEFIQQELASVGDWLPTLSALRPPATEWFEMALQQPVAMIGEAPAELEMFDNPTPEDSFGYISDTVHIPEVDPEHPVDLLLPLHGLTEVDRNSVHIFRWEETMEQWDLLPFSAAHPILDVVWTKVYQPGIYTAIGLATDPAIKLMVKLLSELTPLIRNTRAAGQEPMIVQQLCHHILCSPEMMLPAVAQTMTGTFEMAQLPADEEQMIRQYSSSLERPPREQAGLPEEHPQQTGDDRYPISAPRRVTVGGEQRPKGMPREFPMGIRPEICERCYGLRRPDKIPETQLLKPRIWNPFQPVLPSGVPWSPFYRAQWSGIPMTFPSNVVRDLAIDPDDPKRIYAATQRGGVWRTVNGGKQWQPTTDHLDNLNTYAITVARKKSKEAKYRTVYFGTARNALRAKVDIFASTDGGNSWLRRATLPAEEVWEMITGKDDEDLLYAATDRGLFRSTDGGKTWPTANVKIDGKERKNNKGILEVKCYDVKLDPTDDETVWVCAAGIGILKSTDGGKTWTNTTSQVKTMQVKVRTLIDIGQDKSTGSHGSKFIVAKSRKNLAYSLDGGSNWKELPNAVNTTTYSGWCSALAVCPNDEKMVTAGGYRQYLTTDILAASPKWSEVPGLYWTPWKTPERRDEYHPDQQVVRFDPKDPTFLLLGNDGGISRIDTKQSLAERISDGINANMLFYLDVSQNGDFHIGASTYHCGIVRKESGSSVWKYVESAEGGIYRIDPHDSTVHLCAPWGAGLRRSQKSGEQGSWSRVKAGNKPVYVQQVEFRPDDAGEVWAGAYEDQLQYSTDQGKTWSRVKDKEGVPLTLDSHPSKHAGVSAIAFAPSDEKVIYVGTRGGRLWRTGKAGKKSGDWQQVSSVPKATLARPERFNHHSISAIAVHPKKTDHLYIGYALGGQQTLYLSTDGGKNWSHAHGTMTSGGRLPNFPVVDIVIDPNRPQHVYVALEFGVYFTNNGGIFWFPFDRGLPKVECREMRFRKATRTLYLGTYGRGMLSARI